MKLLEEHPDLGLGREGCRLRVSRRRMRRGRVPGERPGRKERKGRRGVSGEEGTEEGRDATKNERSGSRGENSIGVGKERIWRE